VDPLATFSLSLPAGWGEPLGWALTFLPLSPILLAAIVHLTCGARGVPKVMVRTPVSLTKLHENFKE
jgi:hypothetical protein